VIRQGQALYDTDNGTPVVLLDGRVPAWRALAEGDTGADVSQLNHDLVALGWAGRADIATAGWDFYSWESAYGVDQLEAHLGVSAPAGTLPLGQVVFEPGALRVSHVTASLGSLASGPVLTATSDRHVVTILLSTSQEAEVTPGDAVTVTLPDGTTAPGTVSSVGTVASGTASGATIPVQVTLTRAAAAGTLNLAPVTVNIITARSSGPVLVVPVTALLARAPGAYDVEVAGAGNTRRYVPVRVGIFDDAGGLVQVTGALTPGQRVVVAPA
jgi:multidrug efflux pump subunit AcrA (membrane-fusion protein)